MNPLILAGSILGLFAYFPLWKGLRSGKVGQNLFTWILWAILDTVATASIITQKGNFILPAIYTVGSAITAFIVFKSGNEHVWTWLETVDVALIVACMLVWYASGDKVAIIASTLAMTIAGIMQLIDAWKRPEEMPLLVYVAYLAASILSTAGGKSWSIEERFYPAAGMAYCFVMTLVSARKLRRKT